jgi:hypothetical protein
LLGDVATEYELPYKNLAAAVCSFAQVKLQPHAHESADVLASVERLLASENASSLTKGDAANYWAANLQWRGDHAKAAIWMARGLAWYEKSMSPQQARLRAVRWVPTLTILIPKSVAHTF